MLLHSVRALCLAPGGPGCIWKYIGALVRSTRVSERFACVFRINLHFADAVMMSMVMMAMVMMEMMMMAMVMMAM